MIQIDEKELDLLIYDIFAYVPTFYRTLFKVNEELLKGSGLLNSHLFLMFALKKTGESTPTEQARLLHVTKPNVTILVDKLERLGYVDRLPSAANRRTYLLRLTEKGEEFIKTHMEVYKDHIHHILNNFDGYTQEDCESFILTIRAIKQQLDKKDEIQSIKTNKIR
jgi:DNA-binding MarR family transcriptional regulator